MRYLEEEFKKDIDNYKFIPFLMLHEFEMLVFANSSSIPDALGAEKGIAEQVEAILNMYTSPEEINDDPNTAPSKRLKKIFPAYEKTLHSSLVLMDAKIDIIRKQCRHFDEWLRLIEV